MRSRILTSAASFAVLAFTATALARNPWEGQLPYGRVIMTAEERVTYWAELRARPTVEEKEAYWQAHVERMQQRALARGVSLPPPPRRPNPTNEPRAASKPPYFEVIMTEEERETYRRELGALEDPAERRAYIAEHVERMRARGLARGLPLPSAPASKGIAEERTDATVAEPEEEPDEMGEFDAEFDAEEYLDE